MKIFAVTVLVGLAAALGCRENERYVKVKFGIDMTSDMTKSVRNSIMRWMPGREELRNVVFDFGGNEARFGEDLVVLEGVYEVTGEYAPWFDDIDFGGHRGAERTAFIVADEVEVREGMDYIEAKADWNCWAIVVDRSKVSSVSFDGYVFIPAYDDDYMFLFIEACDGEEWVFGVTPSSELDKVTEWTIEGDERWRAGKWFMYNPDGRVITSGEFSLSFDEWVSGDE